MQVLSENECETRWCLGCDLSEVWDHLDSGDGMADSARGGPGGRQEVAQWQVPIPGVWDAAGLQAPDARTLGEAGGVAVQLGAVVEQPECEQAPVLGWLRGSASKSSIRSKSEGS